MASRPVRWDSYLRCDKCNGVIKLVVDVERNVTTTEHQCSAKTTDQQHINACR